MSGWQLLTGKSFYKAQFINTKDALSTILFNRHLQKRLSYIAVLITVGFELRLLSVPLGIKMHFHIIRVFHTVRGCLQRTAAPKGANDSFFAVGIFFKARLLRAMNPATDER